MKIKLLIVALFFTALCFSQEKTYKYKPLPTLVKIEHEGIYCASDETKTKIILEFYKEEESKWYTLAKYKIRKCDYMVLLPIPNKKNRTFKLTFESKGYITAAKEIAIAGNDERVSIDLGTIQMMNEKK
jgi:hypothetical protein